MSISILIDGEKLILDRLQPHVSENFGRLLQRITPEKFVDPLKARMLLQDWILAHPSISLAKQSTFIHSAFTKNFVSIEHLCQAINGRILAELSFQEDEVFSFRVLEEFEIKYEPLLDHMIALAHQHFLKQSQNQVDFATRDRFINSEVQLLSVGHWFGPVGNLFQTKEELINLPMHIKQIYNRTTPILERLYAKINFLIQYNLNTRARVAPFPPTNPIPQHNAVGSGMRARDGWTLNEAHPFVDFARSHQIALMGGVSSTTSQILNLCICLGLKEPRLLHMITECIVAFYQFAPDNYVKHTRFEVITGANLILRYYDIKYLLPNKSYLEVLNFFK